MDCTEAATFEMENWRSVPVIEQRVATQQDVDDCLAVFATGEGQSEFVASFGLPALANLVAEDGSKVSVVIVQLEKQIGGPFTIAGYVLPSGTTGVATLPELEIVEHAK